MSYWSRCLGLFTLAAPACCVARDTRVRTATGDRPAGALAVGDQILSVDVETGRFVEGTIVQVRRAVRECLALRWRDGALVCTPDHPLYAPDDRVYRPASDWVTGGARRLLVHVGETAAPLEVEAVEAFAGVHEVVDLTLAAEPHNFVADGVVVHNKTPPYSGMYEPVEYLSADADTPTFTLDMPGDTRRFRLRACLDGADFPRGNLNVTISPTTTAELGAGQNLWLSVESSSNTDGPTAANVPSDSIAFYDPLPDDACSAGVVFTFEHVQGPQGAEIIVHWDVGVSTDHDLETPGDVLELSLEPLD